MAEKDVTVRLCRYINKNLRSKYKSNVEFAIACDIDEKTVRLIQQEKYNVSLVLFKRICDNTGVSMSDVLKAIGE